MLYSRLVFDVRETVYKVTHSAIEVKGSSNYMEKENEE